MHTTVIVLSKDDDTYTHGVFLQTGLTGAQETLCGQA
jgi:hypothetical protein